MTREEAIKTIETAKKFAYDECYEKAFDIAINALEQDSTIKNDCAEQNGCISCSLDDGDCCRKLYEESMQEPTTKNDLGVDWESYKDVDGNSLDDLILEVLQNNFDCGNTYGYKVADEIIGLLPSVTPQEPKTKGSYHPIISGNAQNPPKVKSAEIDNTIIHAKWIERDTDEDWWIECSNCGCSQSYYDDTNYCPHCGARMDKEKEI